MPLYEYQCESCQGLLEVLQKFSDEPLSVCKECGGKLKRLLSPPGLHFKGTGWYVTDYAKAPQPKSDAEPDKAAKKTESKKSKPDTTSKKSG